MKQAAVAALFTAAALGLGACAAPSSTVQPTRTTSPVANLQGKSVTVIKPADREPAAVVSGAAVEGNTTISTVNYPGKVLVLNIWGSWCAPCRKEAPDLAAASKTTAKSAQFIGLDIRDPDRAPAQAFTRAMRIGYPSIFDPDGKQLLNFAGDVTPNAIPTTLVIDRQGRVAVRIIGGISKITLVDIINRTAAGR